MRILIDIDPKTYELLSEPQVMESGTAPPLKEIKANAEIMLKKERDRCWNESQRLRKLYGPIIKKAVRRAKWYRFWTALKDLF